MEVVIDGVRFLPERPAHSEQRAMTDRDRAFDEAEAAVRRLYDDAEAREESARRIKQPRLAHRYAARLAAFEQALDAIRKARER